MQNPFEALWWAPYAILAVAAFPAFAAGKLAYRMVLFHRQREVAREMARNDPAYAVVVEVLNPKHLLFEALLYVVLTCAFVGIAIFWSRAA